MWRGEVVTKWRLVEGINRIAVVVDHLEGYTHICNDVTGQAAPSLVPDPNAVVVYIECEEDQFDAIDADGECFVLWAEEI